MISFQVEPKFGVVSVDKVHRRFPGNILLECRAHLPGAARSRSWVCGKALESDKKLGSIDGLQGKISIC